MLKAPEREEEFEKVLVSALFDGSSLVIFDNVEHRLSSPSLARALTAKTFSGRLLGTNIKIDLPVESIFIGNGNNVRMGGDLPRRCYFIQMDPKTSKPWLRDNFKHPDLLKWVRDHRGELAAALLIMARAWIVAGKPSSKTSKIGSFEKWCETVGGILHYAGVTGFLENAEKIYNESDEDSLEWEFFLKKWFENYGVSPVQVSRIYEDFFMREHELADFGKALPTPILNALESKPKNSFVRSLGRYFKKMVGRRFGLDEYRLVRSDKVDRRSGAAMWFVEKCKN
jgi:hypothetical protein